MKAFYWENSIEFKAYLTDVRRISQPRIGDYLSTLGQRLPAISTTQELKDHLSRAYTDPYGRAIKNLFNFMEYREIEEFNGVPLERWRKAVKLRRSGVREIYISDDELQAAYDNISEKVRPLFKLLVFSGVRFSQAMEGLKHLDGVVSKGEICRVPVSAISRGNKKVYWIYFPHSFLAELKRFDAGLNHYTYQKGIHYGRVSASTTRKWHLNFLIEQGVPESVADFIQGRASVTVGSAHYLAKTQQADLWYAKITPKLLSVLQ